MNPAGKKFISLFLVFSLVMLCVNLYAKERRGAKLIVTKKDGQQIEGELITVKPSSVFLLDTEGKDVSIDNADIDLIRVVKKSKALLGAGIGFLIVGSIMLGLLSGVDEFTLGGPISWALYFGVVVGVPVGTLAGVVAGTDKTIQIEGMTDSEIQETLDKLRKKARVRNYK